MAEMSFKDLREQADNTDVLPAAKYVAIARSAKASKSQNGKDMVNVLFEVQGGARAGAPVYNNFVISPENPNALNFFFRHMRSLGVQDAVIDALRSTDELATHIVAAARPVILTLSIRKWQGEDRNQVDTIEPHNGALPAAAAVGLPAPAVAAPAVVPPAPVAVPAAPAPLPVEPAPLPVEPAVEVETAAAVDEPPF